MKPQAKIRRGPLWAYVLGGILLFPVIVAFTMRLVGMRLLDVMPNPIGLYGGGGLLGWLLWRVISKGPADPQK